MIKRLLSLITVLVILLGINSLTFADANNGVIQNFEGYSSGVELRKDIDQVSGSRAEYDLNISVPTNKAMRVTLGGPETETSSLSIPIGSRDWTQAGDVSINITNETHTAGVWFDMYLTSRAEDGREYYLHANNAVLKDISGKTISATKKQNMIELPSDMAGTYNIALKDATMTDENGDVTTKFSLTNVVKVDFVFNTGGKDLADSALTFDNLALTGGIYASATPSFSPTPASLVTPSATDITPVTPTASGNTFLVIIIIAVAAVGGIAVTIVFYTKRKR